MVHLRPVRAGLGVAGAIGFGVLVASTHPFTTTADAVTAAGLAAAVVPAAWTLTGRARASDPAPRAEGAQSAIWPWVVATCLVGTWELAVYFAGWSGARHAFPTASSLYDEVARWRWAKAAVGAVWLALGWALARP